VRQGDQSPDEVGTASGHPDVGQDEGSPVLAGGRNGIVAVRDLRDDAEVGLLLQQPDHGLRDAVVVVRDDGADCAADSGGHGGTLPHGAPSCRDAGAPRGWYRCTTRVLLGPLGT
jgi:hypothetical protein